MTLPCRCAPNCGRRSDPVEYLNDGIDEMSAPGILEGLRRSAMQTPEGMKERK
jgi:hypothetical protein